MKTYLTVEYNNSTVAQLDGKVVCNVPLCGFLFVLTARSQRRGRGKARDLKLLGLVAFTCRLRIFPHVFFRFLRVEHNKLYLIFLHGHMHENTQSLPATRPPPPNSLWPWSLGSAGMDRRIFFTYFNEQWITVLMKNTVACSLYVGLMPFVGWGAFVNLRCVNCLGEEEWTVFDDEKKAALWMKKD